jgi:hypothetical protein
MANRCATSAACSSTAAASPGLPASRRAAARRRGDCGDAVVLGDLGGERVPLQPPDGLRRVAAGEVQPPHRLPDPRHGYVAGELQERLQDPHPAVDVAGHAARGRQVSAGAGRPVQVGERRGELHRLLGELQRPPEVARPLGRGGLQQQHRGADPPVPATHEALGGRSEVRRGLGVPVAQLQHEREQPDGAVDGERVPDRLTLRDALRGELRSRVEVGPEVCEPAVGEAARPQPRLAQLRREGQGGVGGVLVERRRGVGHHREPGQQPGLQHAAFVRGRVDRPAQHGDPGRTLPVQVPQPHDGGGEAAPAARVVGSPPPGEPPVERDGDLGPLGLQERAPRVLVVVEQGLRGLGDGQVVVEMPVAGRRGLGRVPEPDRRVRPDGLQQPVPGLRAPRLGHDERLVHQPGQRAEHGAGVDVAARPDVAGRREAEAPDKDREPAEHRAVGVVEHVVAPRHRRGERLVAGHDAARTPHEQREPVVERRLDLHRRERAQPGGGQLQRDRDAVQPGAHRAHGVGVRLVDGEARGHGCGALGEQRDGLRLGHRRHLPHLLTGHDERLAARREHGDPGSRAQEGGHDRSDAVEHLLAVVEAQQDPLVAELPGQ